MRWIPLLLCAALIAGCTAPPPPTASPTPVAVAPSPTPRPSQPTGAPLTPLPRSPTPAPAPAAPPEVCLARGPFPPLLPGLRYGVNAFLLTESTDRVLKLTTTANFGWVRQQIHWRDIEGERGSFVWAPLDAVVAQARANRLDLLLSVVRSPPWAATNAGLPEDLDAFSDFMSTLAARYRGQVAAYQVWNEPNLAVEGGGAPATPENYLATLRAAYPAIKAADPCALVVSAALAATASQDRSAAAPDLPFLEQLYRLDGGAFLRSADIVAMHPGGGPYDPDAIWPQGSPERSAHYFRHIERAREVMRRHGDQRQVWITEMGWTVYEAPGAPPPVSDELQSAYLLRALYRVRNHYPWVSAAFVWNLNFGVIGLPQDEKSAFGILQPDWSPRPAFLTLQTFLNDEAAADAADQPRLSAESPYRLAWIARLGAKSRGAPAIGPGGTLYAVSDAGRLYAFGPLGGLRWRHKAPGGIRAGPAVTPDGGAVVLDERGSLTALSADGRRRWRVRLGASGRGTPLVHDGRIEVAVDDALVHVASDGTVVRRIELGAETSAPMLSHDGRTRYVTTVDGEVAALDASGEIVWRVRVARQIAAAPAVARDGAVLVADADGALYSLSAADGRVLWRTPVVDRVTSETLAPGTALVSAAPLVAADGTIYVAGRDGSLSALDAGGRVRWRYVSGSDISSSPAFLPGGSLVVGLMDGRIVAVAPGGQVAWEAQLRGAVRASPTVAPDGRLLVATLAGRVYALEPHHVTRP